MSVELKAIEWTNLSETELPGFLNYAAAKLNPSEKDAPNINVENPLEVIHWVGSEALWRVLNGFDSNTHIDPGNIVITMEQVYFIKRRVSEWYQNGVNK